MIAVDKSYVNNVKIFIMLEKSVEPGSPPLLRSKILVELLDIKVEKFII